MMGWRIPEQGWTKGPWTHEEDQLLSGYVKLHGEGRWSSVARCTGLKRSAKSCRLRWVNYLRPGLKKGQLTPLEEGIIIELHALLGNKWSTIARYLPGRTDNEIKNYWRTHFKKREKGKAPILKQKSAPQRQEQQPQEDDMGRTTYADPSGEQGTKKENFYSMYPTFELEDQCLSMMCQDVASWLDTIREDDLCGGLWNLEDLEGDITDMGQPPTGFSCGVDSNNVDDGEYIKFLEG